MVTLYCIEHSRYGGGFIKGNIHKHIYLNLLNLDDTFLKTIPNYLSRKVYNLEVANKINTLILAIRQFVFPSNTVDIFYPISNWKKVGIYMNSVLGNNIEGNIGNISKNNIDELEKTYFKQNSTQQLTVKFIW